MVREKKKEGNKMEIKVISNPHIKRSTAEN